MSSADVVPYPHSWWKVIAVVDSSLFSSLPRVRNCLHFVNLLNCQEDPNKPVTLKDVKLFIVNRQNVSEIFVNIHNVNLFNVKPKELSKAGLYVCKGTKQ